MREKTLFNQKFCLQSRKYGTIKLNFLKCEISKSKSAEKKKTKKTLEPKKTQQIWRENTNMESVDFFIP